MNAVFTDVTPAEAVERVAAQGRRVETPCGDGALVWRIWGAGPPLVLLHGNYGSWLHWIRNVLPLAEQFTVIANDAPGFGESAMPPLPCPPRHHGKILLQGLAEIVVEPARWHLAGFSYGGRLAGEVAALAPDRTASLILLAPGGLGVGDAPWPELRRMTSDMTEHQRLAAHRHNVQVLMIHDPAKADDLSAYIQDWNTRHSRFKLRSWSEEDRFGSLGRVLPTITAPITGIFAAQDVMAAHNLQARVGMLKALQPDAEVHILDGVGHWMPYEAPERINALLLAMAGGDG